MDHGSWMLLLSGVTAACAVALTAVVALTAQDVRRTLTHLRQTTLPLCDRTLRDADRVATQVRQLVTRTTAATQQVTGVVARTCQTASTFLDHVVVAAARARQLLTARFGNGRRAGGHRNHQES